MTARVVVLGSINMDLVVRCATLPKPGETITAASCAEICGGKGANQAVAAARAGGDVSMIGRVGDDAFAVRLVENLDNLNINAQYVRTSAGRSSGIAVVAVEESGENSILLVPGANAALSLADVESARAAIVSADVLLAQLEAPAAVVAEGLAIAKKAGVLTILDPAPAPPQWPGELPFADLLCPNATEAAAITGLRVSSAEEARAAATTLAKQTDGDVVVTLGGMGAVIATGGSVQHVPAIPTDVVDTTGAGDGFAGALAVRLAEGCELPEAVRFATADGALAVSRLGAQVGMGTRAEIEALL